MRSGSNDQIFRHSCGNTASAPVSTTKDNYPRDACTRHFGVCGNYAGGSDIERLPREKARSGGFEASPACENIGVGIGIETRARIRSRHRFRPRRPMILAPFSKQALDVRPNMFSRWGSTEVLRRPLPVAATRLRSTLLQPCILIIYTSLLRQTSRAAGLGVII